MSGAVKRTPSPGEGGASGRVPAIARRKSGTGGFSAVTFLRGSSSSSSRRSGLLAFVPACALSVMGWAGCVGCPPGKPSRAPGSSLGGDREGCGGEGCWRGGERFVVTAGRGREDACMVWGREETEREGMEGMVGPRGDSGCWSCLLGYLWLAFPKLR